MDLDKWKIQHQAIADVIRICGGVQRASDKLELENNGRKQKSDRERERRREQLSKWRNEFIKVPLHAAIEMERVTQVSFERLSPFTEKANKTIRSWRTSHKLLPIEVPCDEIVPGKHLFAPHKAHRPLIVTTDLVLISSLEQWKIYKAAGKEKVPALILDVKSWLLGIKSLSDIKVDFLTSELVAIGLYLKQWIGSHPEQQNDFIQSQQDSKKAENSASACRNCDKGRVRTDQKIAETLGFKSKDTFHRAVQVYKRGIPELVDALDHKKLSFYKAAKISKLPPEQQLNFIATHLKKEAL